MLPIVKHFAPECIVDDHILFRRTVTSQLDVITAGIQALQLEPPVVDAGPMREYVSDSDEEKRIVMEKAKALMISKPSKGNRHTGGLPYHCPIKSCCQRFKDSRHMYEHWDAKLHDHDRSQAKGDHSGLAGPWNRCAKTDEQFKAGAGPLCPLCKRARDLWGASMKRPRTAGTVAAAKSVSGDEASQGRKRRREEAGASDT